MRVKALVCLILLLVSCTASPEDAGAASIAKHGLAPRDYRHLIGLEFPPLPLGCDSVDCPAFGLDKGGLLLWPYEKPMWVFDFGRAEGDFLVFLSKEIESQPSSTWKVHDILEIPSSAENELFIPEGCLLDGAIDYGIAAVAGPISESNLNIRFVENELVNLAWRVNLVDGVFTEIETTGIECHTDSSLLISP